MNSKILPKAPSLKQAIGPSIILLGLGLGSGELILWPYLVSQYGLGIIWAAMLGITIQFFINLEIERYSLLSGGSVFAGFARLSKIAPLWFIFSTFIAWMWPGIIATSAKILSATVGFERFELLAIFLLILIGVILTFGPRLYKTVETFQKYLILVGVPLIVVITALIARIPDFTALGRGVIGIGEGYRFLPLGLPLFTFLGAMAYSGAGGNLNLAQSFYIKEKGYGMCQGKVGISSILAKKVSEMTVYGEQADFGQSENKKRFAHWWSLVNKEHFLVFLLTGAITILLLALLSYITSRSNLGLYQGVDFLEYEARIISQMSLNFVGGIFLALVALMLFGTQLTILDSTSRIISENIVIIKPKFNLIKSYYLVLWFQILAGILVFITGYNDPVSLVVTGAVINAFAMVVHIAMTYRLNQKRLARDYQASWWRRIILILAWLLFVVLGGFALFEAIKAL